MKILFLTLALLIFVSQALPCSVAETMRIAAKNRLYSHMRNFGLQEIVKKAQASHRVQLTANPEHMVHSVRTSLGGRLEVTFDGDIRDVHGKTHRSSFVVSRQGRHDLTKLESYTLSQGQCLKNESLKDCLKREANEKSKPKNATLIQNVTQIQNVTKIQSPKPKGSILKM